MPVILGFLGTLLTSLLTKFIGYATFVIAVCFSIFLGLWLLGTDLASWVFEQLLILLNHLLISLDIDFSGMNFNDYLGGLPSEALNVVAYLGFAMCLKMLLMAVSIRVTINLIPFVNRL